MKKLCTLLLAAGLLLGVSCKTASAIDFKVKGSFQFGFDYISGGNFMGETRTGANVYGQQWAASHQSRDNFEAIQRLHLQIHAIASETLSGTVFFEIGETRFGQAASGGALGADVNMVRLKQAYLDWIVPNTTLKLRMGIVGMKLPGFALDNPILHDDVAGLVASYAFNPTVSLTAMWLRPYNDNWAGDDAISQNAFDNFDLAALLLPLSFNDIKITPWIMAGAMGSQVIDPAVNPNNIITAFNPNIGAQAIDGLQIKYGLMPAAFSTTRPVGSVFDTGYSTLFWGGLTTQVQTLKPWTFQLDFIYGSVDNEQSYLDRDGWFGMALAEYAFDWGKPALYTWYFSGDDANVNNGSESLPYIATTNNLTNSLSTFGYRGSPIMTGGKGVLGMNPNGTWGIGARIKDITIIDQLSHVLRFNFFGGTHSTAMAGYITGTKTMDGQRTVYRNMQDFNTFGTYLTTADTGIEINFDTEWAVYDNLSIFFETAYIHLWLDKDVWGSFQGIAGDSLHYKDAWKATVNIIYRF